MRFRSISICVAATLIVALAVIPGAVAQDAAASPEPESLLEWDKGPAGFLLTKDEEKEWKKVSTEAEAKAFIDLFWAKRNPNPASAFNPFKADFDNRVRYADEQYSHEKGRGALTDRGRVLILMGPPHYSENRFPTETVERIADRSVGTDEVRANAKLWFYDPQQMPEEFKIKGSRLIFTFYEEKAESNYFTLDRSHQEATGFAIHMEDRDVVSTLIAAIKEPARGVEVETAWIIPACPCFSDELQVAVWADGEDPDAVVQPVARIDKLPVSRNQDLRAKIAAGEAGRQGRDRLPRG